MMAAKDQGRTNALLYGAMTEICLGGVVMVWTGTETPLGRNALGHNMSMAVVVGAMVVFGCGMLVALIRPPRAVLVATSFAMSMAISGLGVIAFTSVVEATFFLFVLAIAMAVSLLTSVNRTRSQTNNRLEPR